MIKMAIAPAASALLRALTGRARVSRDRILLTEVRTIEWRSLTFTGERHELHLRVPGPHSGDVVDCMCRGLEDAEFSIPGHFVADIAVMGTPEQAADGSISLTIEALTISAD